MSLLRFVASSFILEVIQLPTILLFQKPQINYESVKQ
jgi:hypothetical protein